MKNTVGFFTTAILLMLTLAGATPTQAQESIVIEVTTPVDLNSPNRPLDEIERDQWSKPIETLQWIGLEPGDVVVDFHAGGGYATWILSHWVGPEGVVFTEMSGRRGGALKERVATGDLAEVGNVIFAGSIEELPTDSLDVFYVVRNYHDYDADEVSGFLDHVARSLKPGGLFVVVDVRAREGRDEDGHRIAEEVVIEETTAAGFELVDSTDLLANPDDTYEGAQWDNRNELDHFALKFRAPESETGEDY
jgi:predicted methyltransferase